MGVETGGEQEVGADGSAHITEQSVSTEAGECMKSMID